MKLSVITICFNNPEELKKTLQSLSFQTLQDFEVVVVDGGSKEDLVQVIKDNDRIINNWVSEPDKGLYDAMNKGMMMSTGDYVIFINSGDELQDKDVLKDIIDTISETNKSYDLYFGRTNMYNGVNSCLRPDVLKEDITEEWKQNNIPVQNTIFFSKKIYQHKKFSLDYPLSADSFFIKECFKEYSSYFIDRTISKFELGGVSNYYQNWGHFKKHLKDKLALNRAIKSRPDAIIYLSLFISYLCCQILTPEQYFKFQIKYLKRKFS